MGGKATTITTAVRLKKKGLHDFSKVENLELLPLFTKLRKIELQHNKLTEISENILQNIRKSPSIVEYLQELDLSHNRLTSLPEELYLLINLRVLRVNHNQITEINPLIFSIYRLEEVYLDHNKIEYLPWNFNKLKKLKKLHLHSTKLRYIPNTISKLSATLIELIIIPNPLTPVPEEEIIWALHGGYNDIIFDYLSKQSIPDDYPFWDDIRKYEDKKRDKLKLYSEDQNLVRLLLKNPKGIASLERYMEKEYSIENLMFWKVINQFGKDYNSDVEITTNELVEDAKLIFLFYIAEESRFTINLPAEIQYNLRRIFTDTFVYPKGINQWVFKPASHAILELISRDTFLRWKATAEGSSLIRSLKERKVKKKEKF